MDKEKVYNEAVGGDEGFAAGDGYPSCDGEPCANVTDESSADADTMAGDRNTPKAASEELPSRDWEAEIAEWQDKYLRLQAEFDNFRKGAEEQTKRPITIEEAVEAGLDRRLMEEIATRESFGEMLRRIGIHPSDRLFEAELRKTFPAQAGAK